MIPVELGKRQIRYVFRMAAGRQRGVREFSQSAEEFENTFATTRRGSRNFVEAVRGRVLPRARQANPVLDRIPEAPLHLGDGIAPRDKELIVFSGNENYLLANASLNKEIAEFYTRPTSSYSSVYPPDIDDQPLEVGASNRLTSSVWLKEELENLSDAIEADERMARLIADNLSRSSNLPKEDDVGDADFGADVDDLFAGADADFMVGGTWLADVTEGRTIS